MTMCQHTWATPPLATFITVAFGFPSLTRPSPDAPIQSGAALACIILTSRRQCMLCAVALQCWSEGGVLVLPHLCEMMSLGGQSEVDEAPTSGVLLAVGGPLVTQGCRSHNALELVSRKETTKKRHHKRHFKKLHRTPAEKMSESVAPAQRLTANTCIRKNSSAESMCDTDLKHDVEAEKVHGMDA